MARWRELENLRLHPHIRGTPDVTGTRKSNGIREEGNEGDVVSQTLLQGGGRHTAHRCTVSNTFLGIRMPKSKSLPQCMVEICSLTISCGVLLMF